MANFEIRQTGELNSYVITTQGPPQLIAVLCHGFGAPGDDLVPLGAELLRLFRHLEDRVQIVFPAAPHSLARQGLPGGRAWWMLDTERLLAVADEAKCERLAQEQPPALESSRDMLLGLIRELQSQTGLPLDRFVLGGFSQGSMLAVETALHLPSPPGGLVVWSGALIHADDWKTRAAALKGVPVFQSHGRQDPILPFASAAALRDLLKGAGADVEFLSFAGQHTIPADALSAAGRLCERLLETPPA